MRTNSAHTVALRAVTDAGGVTAGKRRHHAPVCSERISTQARPVEHRAVPVGPDPAATDSGLAVLVLQVSWALADAAHDLPAGRMPVRRRAELADTLQALGTCCGSAPRVVSGEPRRRAARHPDPGGGRYRTWHGWAVGR